MKPCWMRKIWCVAALLTIGSLANAQSYEQKLFQEMQWRCIGPFRGGRTVAITGVPGQASLFYMAAVNGGVWKTTDFGNTWSPIFDEAGSSGSVGAIAVAPSNSNVLYVGSGEGLQRPDLAVGDGIYKSIDAGKTWTHLGLRDAQQITAIVVDPKDAERLYVAAEGHPYGPNAERGVFRSTDGGQSWAQAALQEPVLSKAFTRFRLPWRWNGGPATLQSRAWDEAGNVQPTRAEFVAARGELTKPPPVLTFPNQHYNSITSWGVASGGEVKHVYA